MEKYVEYELFAKIARTLIRALAIVVAEKGALEQALLEAGHLPFERYETIRLEKLRDIEPSIRAADEASSEKLLELLRKFEGTIQ